MLREWGNDGVSPKLFGEGIHDGGRGGRETEPPTLSSAPWGITRGKGRGPGVRTGGTDSVPTLPAHLRHRRMRRPIRWVLTLCP